jgi:transposase
MLRNWRNRGAERHSGSALHPASASVAPSDPAAEIAQLRRENDRLRRERDMERDILKKAVAIFSEAPR